MKGQERAALLFIDRADSFQLVLMVEVINELIKRKMRVNKYLLIAPFTSNLVASKNCVKKCGSYSEICGP
jgi:hypothetical protein